MLASGRFVLFLCIELAQDRVVVLNAIGGFNEVIAQGRIRLPVKRGLLRCEVARLPLAPSQSGVSGQRRIRCKATDVSNFGKNAGGRDGTDASNGGERGGKADKGFFDGSIDFSQRLA